MLHYYPVQVIIMFYYSPDGTRGHVSDSTGWVQRELDIQRIFLHDSKTVIFIR